MSGWRVSAPQPRNAYAGHVANAGMYAGRRLAWWAARQAAGRARRWFARSEDRPAGRRAAHPRNRKKLRLSRPAGSVRVDGTSYGSYKVPRARRKKRRAKEPLQRQLNKFKKSLPKSSMRWFRDFKTLCMFSGEPNTKVLWEIPVFSRTLLDKYAENLRSYETVTGTVDLTLGALPDTNLLMDLFYKLKLKNNMTSNCKVRYTFVMCADDDNETYRRNVIEDLTDLDYTQLPTDQGPIPAGSLNAEVPAGLIFSDVGSYHAPVFGMANTKRKWKTLTPLRSTVLGPGDTMSMQYARNKYNYRPKIIETENFTHIKNMTVHLLIECQGDIVHGGNPGDPLADPVIFPNNCEVGYGQFQLDAEQQNVGKITYANGKGLRDHVYTHTLDTNALVTNDAAGVPQKPVHADNQQSAIEVDEKDPN